MIQKRFIHFNNFSNFNIKKLSANASNTKYTLGISQEIFDGTPEIMYQAYCLIKDTQQLWSHGQLYNCAKIYETEGSGTRFLADDGTYKELYTHGDAILSYDSIPTNGSTNLISSGGVYLGIENAKSEIYAKLSPVVLFEASSPNYNNITLSDSVANYDYIEVFGETVEGHLLYTKLFNPDGKKFILCTVPVIVGTYASGFSFVFKEYSISGTTLTGNSGASGETAVTQNGKHNHTSSTTTVGITRVVGYYNI